MFVGSAFLAFWVGPRYGKQHMLVYITICSVIGSLSVVAIEILGKALFFQSRFPTGLRTL